MDLIYMNPLYQDVGVLVEPELDLAFGKDENDFACRVHISNHCCEKGYFIYAEGTEYGGIVDSIEVDTASDSVTYSGRSWQGMLESRVILPLQEGEGGGGSRLPKGYTELTHITANGKQYLDMEFAPNQNTRLVLKASFQVSSTSKFLFGARTATRENGFAMNTTGSAYRLHYGSDYFTFGTDLSYTEPFVIDLNKNVGTIGNQTHTFTAETFQAPSNMVLFGVNNNGSIGTFSSGSAWECQVYDDGELIRDYIPCINDSGEVGMYDAVRKKFSGSSGTEAFIAGDVVESSDSGGNQFDVTIETETDSGVSNVNRYLVISGDAHACIAYMLDRVGLPSALFTAAKDAAGVNITKYQFRRYTDAYEGLCDMLASVGMRLQITHVDGLVTLSAAEKYDYSQDEEFESELVDFTSKTHYNKVNHLICLGTGEMENRLVVHLYADEKGKISQTQTFFGIDEYIDTYSDTSVETMDDLIANGTDAFKGLLVSDEITVDFDYDSDSYYIGDIVGSYDSKTGISVSAEITKKIVTVKNGTVNISYQVG